MPKTGKLVIFFIIVQNNNNNKVTLRTLEVYSRGQKMNEPEGCFSILQKLIDFFTGKIDF